jgi:hypothetical protein
MYAQPAELVAIKWTDVVNAPADAEDLVEPYLVEATAAIDAYTHRSFTVPTEATERLYRPTRLGLMVDRLDDIASVDDLAVEVRDSLSDTWRSITTWWPEVDTTDGRVLAITATSPRFPCGPHGEPTVRVTARFGWPAVPAQAHRACLLWATRLYNRESSPAGVMGFGEAGEVRLTTIDPDVRTLLDPLVKLQGMFA